jgi:hypothetical protein
MAKCALVLIVVLLIGAMPVSAQTPTPTPIVNPSPPLTGWQRAARVTRWAAGGFCVADLGTTTYLMGTGKYREGNPLLRPFEQRPAWMGVIKGGQCLVAHEALRRQERRHPKLVVFIGIVATAVSAYATFSNQDKVGRQ